MICKIVIAIVYFLILYLIARISAKDYYKDFPHFLFVEYTQWEAIAIMYIPFAIAILMN